MSNTAFLLCVTVPLALGLGFLLLCCMGLLARHRRMREECKRLRLQQERLQHELMLLRRRREPPAPVAVGVEAFIRLKTLIVRSLHPDAAPHDDAAEKTLRSELFKVIWPEIVRMESEIAFRQQQATPEDPEDQPAMRGAGGQGWRERRSNAA